MTDHEALARQCEEAGVLRNCDLIEGMAYLETCRMCGGDGAYNQTYTVGCGGGYFTMKDSCDYCDGTGIRTINKGKVSRSHLAQIETKRAAILRAQGGKDAD